MIANVNSAIPEGYSGRLINVEADANLGLPAFNIVGMANKTIFEARERVRSALANSDFIFPAKKITVNLAPAEVTKDGTHLDLPIALAILTLSEQLLPGDLYQRLFVGELSLNGETRPIRGIINIVETALQYGIKEIFIPTANLSQARLVPGATLIGVNSLKDLVLHLKNAKPLPVYKNNPPNTNFSTQTLSTPVIPSVVKNNCSGVTPTRAKSSSPSSSTSQTVVKNTVTPKPTSRISSVVKNNPTDDNHVYPLLDHIQGQALLKRALIIAIAGRHNLLLSGPPGSGKTMLAQVAKHLLPPPSPAETLEITKIHSLLHSSLSSPLERPFRAPHHTASTAAIIGGGSNAAPGEISLAHRGILFLDELPEFSRPVLEALRQPLEDGTITVTRTHKHATYPANFMLIATMNPCPCGYYNDPSHPCTCLPSQILNYQKRLSGPILDRIDMILSVPKVKNQDLVLNVVKNTSTDSEHRKAKQLINQACFIQSQRYKGPCKFNRDLSTLEINQLIKLSRSSSQLLQTAMDKLNLSARSYFKIIKVARTIADLDSSDCVTDAHLAEAISLRATPT